MNYIIITVFLIFAFTANSQAADPAGVAKSKAVAKANKLAVVDAEDFTVYSDKNAKNNHYAPSGWMGDYGDIKLDDKNTDKPHSGKTCIRFIYEPKKSQNRGWAGVYWQDPANNWGTVKGGYNLSKMSKLTFWARGANGTEVIKKFVVGGIKEHYPDSVFVEMGPVVLTNDWKKYTINLVGRDLSYISGGFGWSTDLNTDPEGCTFYLDDIKYEVDPSVKPEVRAPEKMPFYVFDDRSSLNNHYIPSGWMGDYGDITIDTDHRALPQSGESCIKITYSAKKSQVRGWAGMYWQNTMDNWGSVDAGYDLSLAKKITFWARGKDGGEMIDSFKVGGISGQYTDSDEVSLGPIKLSKDWQQYTIDLENYNMSYMIGGFCFALTADVNPNGCTFYLDEIKYE